MSESQIYRHEGAWFRKLDEIQVSILGSAEIFVYVLYQDVAGNLLAKPIEEFYSKFQHHPNPPDFNRLRFEHHVNTKQSN